MENRPDFYNLDGPPTWTSPDLIKAGERIWTPTEREFYELGAQDIAAELHHVFQSADGSLQYESELVNVEFPTWV